MASARFDIFTVLILIFRVRFENRAVRAISAGRAKLPAGVARFEKIVRSAGLERRENRRWARVGRATRYYNTAYTSRLRAPNENPGQNENYFVTTGTASKSIGMCFTVQLRRLHRVPS